MCQMVWESKRLPIATIDFGGAQKKGSDPSKLGVAVFGFQLKTIKKRVPDFRKHSSGTRPGSCDEREHAAGCPFPFHVLCVSVSTFASQRIRILPVDVRGTLRLVQTSLPRIPPMQLGFRVKSGI